LARTKYYDDLFGEAAGGQVKHIVNVGCGSDTRAHRFGPILKRAGVNILECDLPEAILTKQQLAKRLGPGEHIQYLSLDLNDLDWPDFTRWLEEIGDAKVLVMIEGVSPYINDESFGQFLAFLGANLSRGSVVAYDFKLRGVADTFGRTGRTENPFRLPNSREEQVAYHEERGFKVTHLELSWELEARLLPILASTGVPLYRQDGLLQLRLG
jgi:methyltransferase (TIGR00027 family)